ncbi:MAG: alternative ribosome rescue aminoacyl-tRNA hydrolase ArfB [Actinomycetota bacterium]
MRDLDTRRGVIVPSSELTLKFSRSGGPGGQNVNKRDTQVEIIFDVRGSNVLDEEQRKRVSSKLRNRIDSNGMLHVTSSEERTQALNRERALERMEELLFDALAPPPPKRRATRPSKTAVERRISDKKKRGEVKRLRRAKDD